MPNLNDRNVSVTTGRNSVVQRERSFEDASQFDRMPKGPKLRQTESVFHHDKNCYLCLRTDLNHR
jgi:hypothetical protein